MIERLIIGFPVAGEVLVTGDMRPSALRCHIEALHTCARRVTICTYSPMVIRVVVTGAWEGNDDPFAQVVLRASPLRDTPLLAIHDRDWYAHFDLATLLMYGEFDPWLD